MFAPFFSFEDVEDEVDGETNFVVVNLGVRYQFTKMLELGIATGYEYFSSWVHPYYDKGDHLRYADLKDNHFVHLAVESKVDWFCFINHVQVYSRLGAGAILKEDDYEVKLGLPNFQFSPIGVEIVGPVGIYVERGVGYRGLFSGGLSFRF